MKVWMRSIDDVYEFVIQCMSFSERVQVYQEGQIADAKEIFEVMGRIDTTKPCVVCLGSKNPKRMFKFFDMIKKLEGRG